MTFKTLINYLKIRNDLFNIISGTRNHINPSFLPVSLSPLLSFLFLSIVLVIKEKKLSMSLEKMILNALH